MLRTELERSMSTPKHDSNYWFEKGKDSFSDGKWEEAIESYNKCIKADQNRIDAWKDKCEALNFLGRYREAFDCSEKALKIEPKNANILAIKSEALNFLGRYREALDCSEKALKIEKHNGYALYVKAYALDYSGKHNDAIVHYDEAIKLDPDEPEYWTNKGIALNYSRNYQEAKDCFEEALTRTPKNIAQSICYILLNQGESFYRLKDYAKASECYKKALEESAKALGINPRDSHAWTFQGICLYRIGWHERAIRYFDRVIEDINPEFDLAWYQRGCVVDSLGRNEEAIKYYEEAINRNPNDADYCTSNGIALYDLEEYDKALESFEKATALDPSYDIAYLKIGECKYRKQDYSEALRNYEKVSDPQYFGIKHNNMGLCYYQSRLYKNAENEYHEAIKFDSKLVEAYYNLGVLYNNITKQKDEAKRMFEKCDKNNLISSKAKEAIKLVENTSHSQLEWFRWWFGHEEVKKGLGHEEVKKGLGHEEVKKGLGIIIMFSILALIVAIAIVILYLSIIKGEITPSGVSGLTIMIGFLVLIMLLPSLRKFKVAEIELETIEITSVKPENDLEPTLSPKLPHKPVSV